MWKNSDNLTTIRYYFTKPGTKVFPYWHKFMSQDFRWDMEPYRPSGEQVGSFKRRIRYDVGSPPNLIPNDPEPCGSKEAWQNGATLGIDPPLEQSDWGYSICCLRNGRAYTLDWQPRGSHIVGSQTAPTFVYNHVTSGSLEITSGSAVSVGYPLTPIPPYTTTIVVSSGEIIVSKGVDPISPTGTLILGSAACPCIDIGCDDEPTDPSMSDLLVWLKADSLGLSDLDPVATWDDQSGNGYDATQSNPSVQPIYHDNVINGLPAISFDGTQYLASAVNWSTPITVFAVFKHTADVVGSIIGSTYGGVQFRIQPYFSFGVGPFGPYELVQTFTTIVARSCQTLAIDTWTITSFQCDQTNVSFKQDTCQAETQNAPITIGGSASYIGTIFPGSPSELLIGDLAELLVYSTALDDADIQTTTCYLKAKYAL